MKLWLISQNEQCGYDTYDSAVVAAETEIEAQRIHPNEYYIYSEEFSGWAWKMHVGTVRERSYNSGDWCAQYQDVQVDYLGDACDANFAGVVCASFNAG